MKYHHPISYAICALKTRYIFCKSVFSLEIPAGPVYNKQDIPGERKGKRSMQVNLTTKEFRRLLDLVYIGNWVLNSIRGEDRFVDYDHVESKLFGLCQGTSLDSLAEIWNGVAVPSRAFNDGGIQEAIVNYEDAVFFDVLAEELARRDMGYPQITPVNYEELVSRMEDYLQEFELHGTDNIVVESAEV